MIDESIAFWSATRQAAGIRDGLFSSRDLLELFIARIERLNPTLNCVVTKDFEVARRGADAADTARANGEDLGVLHGLPITVKDALMTKGLRSTGGARELAELVPEVDAPTVAAVRGAGAVIMGKTNLPRWSGDIQSFNDLFGTTGNPWNTERTPGGSSGGAACAVAAGLTSFEIGTDIGGSIRFPAAFCGIYGHKPTWGVVPSTGYLDHVNGGTTEADVNVIGPLARSADDLPLLMDVMQRRAGPLLPNFDAEPENPASLRLAAWIDDPFCPLDENVKTVLTAAVEKLRAGGISITAASPDLDPARAALIGGLLVGAATSSHSDSPPTFSHPDWLGWQTERETMCVAWATFFETYDVAILPVAFVPPFPHQQDGDFGSRQLMANGEARRYLDVVAWTILVGMARLPSTVVPVGFTDDGLPIAAQIVGRPGADRVTMAFASLVGDLCGGYHVPPIAQTA